MAAHVNSRSTLGKIGRAIFAIAMTGLGVQYLTFRFAGGAAPTDPWTPSGPVWASLTAAILLGFALSVAMRKYERELTRLLALTLFLRAMLVYAPGFFTNIRAPGPWTLTFELLAMCGAALVLANTFQVVGRYCVAVSLAVYGAQHFIYAAIVAKSMAPWMPGRIFFAWFVGGAFVATALAIVARKFDALATALLGLMFLFIVALQHVPRVIATPHIGKEWTNLLVALAMTGGAWIVAGSLSTVTDTGARKYG